MAKRSKKPRILYAFSRHIRASDANILHQVINREKQTRKPVGVIAIESAGSGPKQMNAYMTMQKNIDRLHQEYTNARKQGMGEQQLTEDIFGIFSQGYSPYTAARLTLAAVHGLIVYPLEYRTKQSEADSIRRKGAEIQKVAEERDKELDLRKSRDKLKEYLTGMVTLSRERERYVVDNTPAIVKDIEKRHPHLKGTQYKIVYSIGNVHTPMVIAHSQAKNANVSGSLTGKGPGMTERILKRMLPKNDTYLTPNRLTQAAIEDYLSEHYFGRVVPEDDKQVIRIARTITPRDFEELARETRGKRPLDVCKAILAFYHKHKLG
jgi:hypothetical protein